MWLLCDYYVIPLCKRIKAFIYSYLQIHKKNTAQTAVFPFFILCISFLCFNPHQQLLATPRIERVSRTLHIDASPYIATRQSHISYHIQ